MDDSRAFYEREYQDEKYSNVRVAENHSFYPVLDSFIEKYGLKTKRCLEVGCGRGFFQDLVPDYTAIDISFSAGKNLNKPFCQASAVRLPFNKNSFDAIWSYAVLEHVPDPEDALIEMRRVLKPGGYLLLAPAWHCRPWAAEGYPVRPYSDFNWKGKWIKASVLLREPLITNGASLKKS